MNRLIAVALVVVGVGAVGLIFEKYFVFAFLRLTEAPTVAEPEPTKKPLSDPLVVDFRARRDLAVFEERKPHTIQLLRLIARPLTFKSQGTLIDYKDGEVAYLTAYLVPEAVSYREAVQSIASVVKTLGLSAELNLAPYETNLEAIPDPEPYIPRAGWRPYDLGTLLNCGWSRTQKAALEINTVLCRPYLFIDRAVASDAN